MSGELKSVIIYGASGGDSTSTPNRYPISIDGSTLSLLAIDNTHHEVHEGNGYFISYSVASVGALTTPNDTMTLSFTTPNTTKWGHFVFTAEGPSGGLVQLIEGKTGGGTSPTGSLTIYNHNRNSANTSGFLDLAVSPVAGKVSYDATVFTGGTTIWSQYIPGATVGIVGSGLSAVRDEVILKQNTSYQLSLMSTTTNPGTLYLSWYEHTNIV